jgi:hypothetical protein
MLRSNSTKFRPLADVMRPKTFALALVFSGLLSPAFAVEYVVNGLTGGSNAFGINNSGRSVGLSIQGEVGYATIWNGTAPTYLGTLAGGSYAGALGIDNSGEVVGYSEFEPLPTGGNFYATIWNGTTPTMLGLLPGINWSASAKRGRGSISKVVENSDWPTPLASRCHAN